MNQLIVCIDTAKQALQETKTIVTKIKDRNGDEQEIEQVTRDIEQAKKAIKFMAAYAFKVPTQG